MWFAFYGALLTCFKYWLMGPLTNILKCDLNSKNLFWLPNWGTMEQWHLWFIVGFYFLALTLEMRWSLFICIMRTILSHGCWGVCLFLCNNFNVVSPAKLTRLYAVVESVDHTRFCLCLCYNHGIKKRENTCRLFFFSADFSKHMNKVDTQEGRRAEVINTVYGARKSWFES